MVNVVYWLHTGGLLARADWLLDQGSAATGAVSAFAARVNRVNSRSALSTVTAP